MLARISTATLQRNVPVVRLKDDEELREIYQFERKLGHGSFGAVYEATHIESQTIWAIKIVKRPKSGTLRVWTVENEINILKEVNHAHIIHLEAIYNTDERIYFVTELCKGGDLKKLLQKKTFFKEDETRYIISCLADAVSYLHQREIVHRDLKLENILVKNSLDEDDGRIDIKVADFGLSIKMNTGFDVLEFDDNAMFCKMMNMACGTPMYMAPEMIRDHRTTRWCDMWSIGVIVFILLCGEPPFVSKTKEDLLKEIMNKGVQFTQPAWATVSDAAKHLLKYLLRVDPTDRLSAPDVLGSSWIAGENSVPSGPTNKQEMIQHFLENEKSKQTLEFSSLEDFEDVEPPQTSMALSKETDSSPTPSTSTQPCHASEKCSAQLGAEQRRPQDMKDLKCAQQRRPQDKKNLSTGQTQDCNATKAKDQTSSSSKVGPSSVTHQLAVRPKNAQHKMKKNK